MKRLACLFTCLMMLALCATAYGAARMPDSRGVLTDDADALGAQTAQDIASYAELLKNDTDVQLHVVIVHFLDGMDVQTYANELFTRWTLGQDDLLLLGAAGEDSFASAMGANVKRELGEANAENLMYTSSRFAEYFRSQKYDAAFASYFVALNTLVEKQYDERISLGSLFESAQVVGTAPAPTTSAAEFGSQLYQDVISAIQGRDDSYQDYHENRERESNGIGVGGWIVLAILIMIIFGQSDPVRKARRQSGRDYRRYGCGCSPLGWIFSIFGLNVLFDNLRRRR